MRPDACRASYGKTDPHGRLAIRCTSSQTKMHVARWSLPGCFCDDGHDDNDKGDDGDGYHDDDEDGDGGEW